MLRIGSVPYLNALPLVQGLDVDPSVTLVREVPSRLIGRLRSGEVHAALVSSVELFREPALGWLDVATVSSRGPVRSILLFCDRDPIDVRSLGLDKSSRSAAAMSQVILEGMLGASLSSRVEVSPDRPLSDPGLPHAVLRIGDPALATDPAGRQVLDLGEVWTESTGLPFVYALWLVHPDADLGPGGPAGLRSRLARARQEGLAARDALAAAFAREHGMEREAAVSYLRDAIRYDFGADERAGLARFGALAHELGLVDHPTLPEPLG